MTVTAADEVETRSWTRRRTYGLVFGILYAGVVLSALFPVSLDQYNPSDAPERCGMAVKAAFEGGDTACGAAGRGRLGTGVAFLLLSVPFGVAYVAASARERD